MSDKLTFFFVQLQAVDIDKPVKSLSPIETFAAYIRFAGDREKAGYVEELLIHGREYLESSEIAFDEVTRSDIMSFEREKYYIKMSDNATIQAEKIREIKAKAAEKVKEAETKASRKQCDIALNMLAMGMDISTIAKATGLSEDAVIALKQ